jgi:hypothetical protein
MLLFILIVFISFVQVQIALQAHNLLAWPIIVIVCLVALETVHGRQAMLRTSAVMGIVIATFRGLVGIEFLLEFVRYFSIGLAVAAVSMAFGRFSAATYRLVLVLRVIVALGVSAGVTALGLPVDYFSRTFLFEFLAVFVLVLPLLGMAIWLLQGLSQKEPAHEA